MSKLNLQLSSYKRIIMSVLVFTLMWTGTLLHDQLGLELSKLASNQNFLNTAKGNDVLSLLSTPERCPCAAHTHSPLVSAGVDETDCQKNVGNDKDSHNHFQLCRQALLATISHFICALSSTESPPANPAAVALLAPNNQPIYILKRALLI
ncbi:MAG: hypothetical protein SFV17_19695 [Candidatus Obscuribacter sp.]|nr:hypothetical protein [Candidatus Melainabacteria bacterium]MDX1988919.1 hypothetical protein [Candidatus Obscuribacter sp.]